LHIDQDQAPLREYKEVPDYLVGEGRFFTFDENAIQSLAEFARVNL
jgi:hypothetical protein